MEIEQSHNYGNDEFGEANSYTADTDHYKVNLPQTGTIKNITSNNTNNTNSKDFYNRILECTFGIIVTIVSMVFFIIISMNGWENEFSYKTIAIKEGIVQDYYIPKYTCGTVFTGTIGTLLISTLLALGIYWTYDGAKGIKKHYT